MACRACGVAKFTITGANKLAVVGASSRIESRASTNTSEPIRGCRPGSRPSARRSSGLTASSYSGSAISTGIATKQRPELAVLCRNTRGLYPGIWSGRKRRSSSNAGSPQGNSKLHSSSDGIVPKYLVSTLGITARLYCASPMPQENANDERLGQRNNDERFDLPQIEFLHLVPQRIPRDPQNARRLRLIAACLGECMHQDPPLLVRQRHPIACRTNAPGLRCRPRH